MKEKLLTALSREFLCLSYFDIILRSFISLKGLTSLFFPLSFSLSLPSSFIQKLTFYPLSISTNRGTTEYGSTIKSKINNGNERRQRQQNSFAMQHSGFTIASLHMVSTLRLEFLLLGSIIAENYSLANFTADSQCGGERCWAMGEFSTSTLRLFELIFHPNNYTDLQGIESIWRVKVGN